MTNTSKKRNFELSINKNIINKGDAETRGWYNVTFGVDDFIKHIEGGFAWGVGVLNDPNQRKRPKKVDIEKSILFAIDIDNEEKERQADGILIKRKRTDEEGYYTYNEALNDPFVKDNALLIYKSPSYKDEYNKFRIVFLLPDYIHSIEEYEKITNSFISYFKSDTSGTGWERLWYSNNNDPDIHIFGNEIKQDVINDIVSMYGNFKAKKKPQMKQANNTGNGDAIGDYKRKADVHQLLTKHGWSLVRTQGHIEYWKRPGDSDKPHNATYNYYPGEFYCFTSSTILEANKTYDAFELFKIFEHNGDQRAAVKELYDLGYGNNGHKVKVAKPDKPLMNGNNDDLIVYLTDESTGEFQQFNIKIADVDFCLNDDEFGDARLLSILLKDQWIFDHDERIWYNYKEGCWLGDYESQFFAHSREILKECYIAYYDYLVNQISEIIRDDDKTELVKAYEKTQKELTKRLNSLKKKNRVANVNTVTESYLKTRTKYFDADPNLINLKNGIYDLKNFKFIKANSDYLCQKQSGAIYDPDAKCDYWLQFLDKIFDGSKEIIRFIQQNFGLWLSGLTDSQHVLFCYGTGANGKSTLFKVAQMLLNGIDEFGRLNENGGYYTTIDIDALLTKKNANQTGKYDLAKLQGARLAIASEIPINSSLNESIIKDLSGGDSVNARHPFGRPFSFFPTHKLAMFGNTKPNVRDTTYGFWRRMQMIPFEVTIPIEERKDISFLLGMFQKELSAIFNWSLNGWKDYKDNGLIIPEAVKVATKAYKEQSDILEDFFYDAKLYITIDPSKLSIVTKGIDFYRYFQKWVSDSPDERKNEIESPKAFYEAMENKGFKVIRTKKPYMICGCDYEKPDDEAKPF
jgi:P4 family phage/plasmid primase-like protien